MASAIASEVEDSGKILTVKSVAYMMGVPISDAQDLMQKYFEDAGQKLSAFWSVFYNDQIKIVSSERLKSSNFKGARLYSLQRKADNACDLLNDCIDMARNEAARAESDRFFLNKLTPVGMQQVSLRPDGVKLVVAPDEEIKSESPAKSARHGKSAADFFRAPSLGSASTTTRKSAEQTTGGQSKVMNNAASSGIRGMFGAKKVHDDSVMVDIPEEPVSLVTEKPPSQKASPIKASTETKSELSKPKSPNVKSPEPSDVKSPEPSEEFDEEDSESDASSSDESLENEPAIKESTGEPDKVSNAHAGTKANRKVKSASKVKRQRVVDSDEEDEDKLRRRTERKEERRLEREERKAKEAEAKRRREVEEKEEAKLGFLKQIGAGKSPARNVVKKKVLRSRTFLDSDGFEVTEDVMEEVEVEEEPVEIEDPKPVTSKASSSLKKSEPKPSTIKPTTSLGKQASLTSFFGKKG